MALYWKFAMFPETFPFCAISPTLPHLQLSVGFFFNSVFQRYRQQQPCVTSKQITDMTVAYWPTSESPPTACKKTLFRASNKYHCYISIKPRGRRGLGDGGGGHSREWKKLHRGGMKKDGEGKGTGGPGLQCLVGWPNTPSRSGASESLEAPHKGKMTRAVKRVDVGGRRRRLKSIKPSSRFPIKEQEAVCASAAGGEPKKLLDRSTWLTRRGKMEQNVTNKCVLYSWMW